MAAVFAAIVAALLAVWHWRRSLRRTWAFGSSALSGSDLTAAQLREVDAFMQVTEHLQEAMDEPSSLRRVVAIGESVQAEGVTVDVLMLDYGFARAG